MGSIGAGARFVGPPRATTLNIFEANPPADAVHPSRESSNGTASIQVIVQAQGIGQDRQGYGAEGQGTGTQGGRAETVKTVLP